MTDSEKLLELVGEYARGVLADTTAILELAQGRAQAIPKTPELAREVRAAWSVIGELVMRVRALELEMEEIRKDLGR